MLKHLPPWSRTAAAALLAVSAAVITACGGGGDAVDAPVATADTATSFAAGPISGFGSVIVNGIRYDDSSASITDDSGASLGASSLKLGMSVEVDGTALDAAKGTARALRIRLGSELVGPLTAIDTANGVLTVLGQTVKVTSTTVFDDSLAGGITGLDTADILEVHAQFNASDSTYTALRVEDAASATAYKLQGTVSSLNTTAKTFVLGGQTISYASLAATAVPSALADGVRAGVRLQRTAVNGQWVATSLRVGGTTRPADGVAGHLRGRITAFTSATSFEINGRLTVNATNASFPDGQAGLALGTAVEVQGTVTNGVLVATSVEIDDRHAGDRHLFRLIGTMAELDTTAKTFKLRGVTVSYAASTVTFKDGTAADLANGKNVEVRGTPSADRTQLVASEIRFK
jgi:hypothetical protein